MWLRLPTQTTPIGTEELLPENASLPELASRATAPSMSRPEDMALIMFTSGSTGAAKAVPLTHAGLLWNCAQRLAASPHIFDSRAAGRDAGTLSFLPNFHVIGFTNNFLFNLYAGGLPLRPRLPPYPTPTSQATQEPSV